MTRGVSERDIALKAGGIYTVLTDLLSIKKVYPQAYNATQTISSLVNATVVGVSSTMIPAPTTMAVNNTEIMNGGVAVARGAWTQSVPVADLTLYTNSFGSPVNVIPLLEKNTNRNLKNENGEIIYGIMTACSTVADGDTINGVSFNLEISFAVKRIFTWVSQTFTGDLSFGLNRIYAERFLPEYSYVGSNPFIAENYSRENWSRITATTSQPIDTIFNIITGGAGYSVTSNGDPALGSSATYFADLDTTQIYLNGAKQVKGEDVIWISSTTFRSKKILDVTDIWEIVS